MSGKDFFLSVETLPLRLSSHARRSAFQSSVGLFFNVKHQRTWNLLAAGDLSPNIFQQVGSSEYSGG